MEYKRKVCEIKVPYAICAVVTLGIWIFSAFISRGADGPASSDLAVLEKAANAGDLSAQFKLGNRYFQGEGVRPDHDAGMRWLRKAADAGQTDAQFKLGVLEEAGIGRKQDLNAALDWYERAAQGSNAVAQFKTGMLYLTQTNRANHYHVGTNWLGRSAIQGYGPAQFVLADLYGAINQPSPFKDQAIERYWGSAIRGSLLHQMSLVRAFKGKDPAESYKWLLLASKQSVAAGAELENTRSQYSVEAQAEGERRAESFVVEPLVEVGLRLYRSAAEQGVADAQYRLAVIYLRDDEQSLIESYKWLKLAADQEHVGAASMMRHIDKNILLKYFQERFQKGYTEEQKEKGGRLAKEFKVKELPKAWRLSEESRYFFPVEKIPGSDSFLKLQAEAEAGNADAQLRLGIYYLHEPLRVPGRFIPLDSSGKPMGPMPRQRVDLAAEWLEKAAKQGNPDAQIDLAFILLNRPAKEQNLGEARRLLGLAAEKKIEAQYQLAKFLEQQQQAGASLADQFKYYRMAAEQGHAQARERLQALTGKISDAPKPTANPVPSDKSADGKLKLGILVSGPALINAADMLTVSLSQIPGTTVLERSQLDKVFTEQSLVRSQNKDQVKVGKLLSADGLIVMEMFPPPQTNVFMLRVIAVKPGVIISEHRHRLVPEELEEWSRLAIRQLNQPLAKLGVSAGDAIPLSILNLRSALVSSESSEKEAQLTWLLTRRLVQQPQLFVLERKQLDKLADETALSGGAADFWNGAYTLEGGIDRDRVKAGITTVDVRLTSAKSVAKEFHVSGPTDQLSSLVEQMATNITAALTLKTGPSITLSPLEEAANYYDEAKWAFRWQLIPEAQQASEASWALGLHRPDVAILRLRSYADPRTLEYGEAFALNGVRRSLELALDQMRRAVPAKKAEPDLADAARKVLGLTSRYLVHCAAMKSTARPKELSELRSGARELADLLGQVPGIWKVSQGECLVQLVLDNAWYWEEDFEGAQKRLEALIDRGAFHDLLDLAQVWGREIKITPFTWRDPAEVDSQKRYKLWLEGLCHRADPLRVEFGFYQLLMLVGSDYEFEDRLLALLAYMKGNRPVFVENKLSPMVWGAVKNHLERHRYESFVLTRLHKEEFAEAEQILAGMAQEQKVSLLKARLQEDVTDKKLQWKGVTDLAPYPNFTKEQALMLEPLLDGFEKQIKSRAVLTPLRKQIETALRGSPPVSGLQPSSVYRTPTNVGFPYRTNQVVSGPGLQLLPQGSLSIRQYTNLVFQAADDNHAWFEIIRVPADGKQLSIIEFLQVDLATLKTVTVPFPPGNLSERPGMALPQRAFLLHQKEVYLLLTNRLWRLNDNLKDWTDTGFSLPAAGQLFSIGSHIVALTSAGVLQVDLVSKTVNVLGSSRRRPAVNIVDEVESLEAANFYASPEGDLCLQLGTSLYTYTWKTQGWTQRTGWPDAKQRMIQSSPGTVTYLSINGNRPTVMGWTLQESAPSPWLTVNPYNMHLSPGRLPPQPSRWLIPDDLAKIHTAFADRIHLATVHWDHGSLWAVFARMRNINLTMNTMAELKEHPPFVMIATEAGMEPLVCPLKLTAPKGFDGTDEQLVRLIEQSSFTSLLTPRHLVVVAKDMPAMWSIPRAGFDVHLAAQARQPKLGRNQRWLQLQQNEGLWLKRYDRNNDGELDEQERKPLAGDFRYQANQAEMKKLEEQYKGEK